MGNWCRLGGLCLLGLVVGCGQQRPKEAWEKREQVYTDFPPAHWLQYMEKRDPRARKAAGRMLVDYTVHGDDQVPAMVEILERSDRSGVRRDVVRALGEMKSHGKAAAPALCKALKDTSWEERDVAAETLGRIGDRSPATIAALVAALNDSDERVRLTAARALGMLKASDAKTISALTAALADESAFVQAEAAMALQRIGPPAKAAIPALKKAAASQDFSVKFNAQEALKAVGGQ